MKIIRDWQWKDYQRLKRKEQRVSEAYRWLSEFDSFLRPLWRYLDDDNNRFIEDVRTEMRTKWTPE